jgi:hypothetical protein
MEFSQGYRKDPLKTWMAGSEFSTLSGLPREVPI